MQYPQTRSAIRRLAASLSVLGALGAVAPAAQAQSEPFIGQIMCAGFNFAPRGWARLDGQIMSIAQNSALFSLLGTTYGGDGRTTFGLPDMRGRMMVHEGQGPGLSYRQLGERAGTETVTISATQMPSHSHSVAPVASTSAPSTNSPTGALPATAGATKRFYATGTADTTMASSVTSLSGGGQPVNNMPPYLVMECFIATEGIYPSRP